MNSFIECEELNKKMLKPLQLDVENIPWKIQFKIANSLQGIVLINMIHVT